MKKTILNWINAHETEFTNMAKQIWEHPQLAYEETFAADLQSSYLREKGFSIQSSIAEIPTAFVAEYGSGKPIIGILGEYDALPGLSQSVSTKHEEVIPGGPGHGCGHNLLGTAGVEAVVSIKEAMELENLEGTIRYYGCPAEEVLSGKTFMARAGAFDDLDCALTWHPSTTNLVTNMTMQSMVSVKYRFHGVTAHAAAAPHVGKSALDAVELMNAGTNSYRERILDGFRMHYVITDGGLSPNIVPETAEVWYYLRASSKKNVEKMLQRVNEIAEGAALMTDTKVTSEIIANVYEILPNTIMSELMSHNMDEAGTIEHTKEEEEFATKLVETVDPEDVKKDQQIAGGAVEVLPVNHIYLPELKGKSSGGSTDAADVSWITPMGIVVTVCAPVGVQVHTWQATASFGSTIGFKGMHHAAKTMALSGYDLLINKDNVLTKARQEFEERTKESPYVAGIPEDVLPPVNSMV